MTARIHVSVLSAEVLERLDPRPGGTFVDGTLGAAGHTKALADRVGPDGWVLSLDRDPAAMAAAEANLVGLPVKICRSNFNELPKILRQENLGPVDGILLDLGFSSDQMADPERGFSFDVDGPLDMRFDPDDGESAWDLVRRLPEKSLADLIYEYGEEPLSRRIAKVLVEFRRSRPTCTAREFAAAVRTATGPKRFKDKIDPATKTFQAIRIAVNRELEALDSALKYFPACLKIGGRLAIISFHSLEDRRVKEAFRQPPWESLEKKPVIAGPEELARNPRARSAKLRVGIRTV